MRRPAGRRRNRTPEGGAEPAPPYGVRGVGETPIVPPMAAIANAIENATGVRFSDQPMSPLKMLAALDQARAKGAAKI